MGNALTAKQKRDLREALIDALCVDQFAPGNREVFDRIVESAKRAKCEWTDRRHSPATGKVRVYARFVARKLDGTEVTVNVSAQA